MIQQLTKKQKDYLNDIVYGQWVLNSKTGLIDVDGDVYLSNRNLTKIPVKFGKVTENFRCDYNQLITLEGSPKIVEGGFDCGYNKLTSLKGCPKIVKREFYCDGNQLQSSKYLPLMIANYDQCIKEINLQKTEYLIDMGFDPKQRKLFKQLMDELDK